MAQDSPLSISASIIGILTFAIAITARFYARALWLKEQVLSDREIADMANTVAFYIEDTVILLCDYDNSKYARERISWQRLYEIEVYLVLWCQAKVLYIVSAPAGAR